jgi:hypothetical protein
MNVVVSPYHLTTREAPAMASLLLAERVVTLLPASLESDSVQAAKRAAERSPWYTRFMETWGWTTPLWDEGVISSRCNDDDVAADMREIAERVRQEERYFPLRPLMREHLFEDDHTYLSSLGADLVKGGPDPGITVPMAAALDRFARRHACCVARALPVSVVQKAEANFAKPLCALALPVFLQASAEHLLLAREVLQEPLDRLRDRFHELAAEGNSTDAARDLAMLAGEYTSAFEANSEDLKCDADDEVRAVVGSVVVSAVAMPADVVLRSSLIAVERLAKVPLAARREESDALPVLAADAGSVVSMVIKPMGAQVRRR